MPAHPKLSILLASPDAALLSALEPALTASGMHVEVVLSAEAALPVLTSPHPPDLALLDVTLAGKETVQLVTAVRSDPEAQQISIVLILDTLDLAWVDRVNEGVIDDMLPRGTEPALVCLRAKAAIHTRKLAEELELLREADALNEQLDRLTGVYNREAMLGMLFRETDRVQRMNSSLCLILFDIDDFGHWNSRLGCGACDELLCQVVTRATCMLRSYDLLGRVGKDEFLVCLPGGGNATATMMAERLCREVFSSPFRLQDNSIRLSACFGISSSNGRSPLVVMREAEQALQRAKASGPESIECWVEDTSPAAPASFLSSSSDDELLAW